MISSDNKEQAATHHSRYDAHYDDAGRVVWTMTQEPVKFVPEQPVKPPVLNRAERRRLARYIARKTRAQMTVVKHRKPWLVDATKLRCPHCNLLFIGGSANRCQCQVQQRHHCLMCGAAFMASQQEYKVTNVCPRCAAAIQAQWDNEEASRAAAYEHYKEISEAEMRAVIDEVGAENGETLRALADL